VVRLRWWRGGTPEELLLLVTIALLGVLFGLLVFLFDVVIVFFEAPGMGLS
jgi:hypothetical protein